MVRGLMSTSAPLRQFLLQGVILAVTAGGFVLDLLTPLGYHPWLLYLLPILLTLHTRRPMGWALALAGLCSILIGVGFYASSQGVAVSFALENRLIGLALLWAAAVAVVAASVDDPVHERLIFGLSRSTISNLTSGCLVMILMGFITFRTTLEAQESERSVARAHEVLTELVLVLSRLKDAETGQRSFLLTGRNEDLEPYQEAVEQVRGPLDRLKSLTQENRLQQGRLLDFEATMEEKLAELQETITAHRNEGADAARRIVESGRGKTIMDNLRRRAAEVEEAERDLLDQWARQAAILFRSQILNLMLGGFALTGLLTASVLLLRREQSIRREHAAALQRTLTMLDTTTDGMFIFDPRTLRFSYVNEGAVTQTSYSREELLRMTPLDIKPEFDEPRFRDMLAPLVSGAESAHSFTTVHRHKDGMDVPVEINLQCVGAGTEQARMVAIVRDISERKLASEALRKASEEIRDLYDHAPCGYHSLDQDGLFLNVNQTELDWLGFTREELVGKRKWSDVVTPESAARFRAMFPIFKQRGRVDDLEFDLIRKDGSLMRVSLNAVAVTDEAGAYVHSRSTLFDITARKRAEEAVKESEQRLSLALDSAQMGAWELDLINDTAIRSLRRDEIFDYPSLQPAWGSEIFLTHVVPEDRDLVKTRFEEAFATDRFSLECRILWPDHSLHWITAQGRVYRNHQNKPVRMIGVVTDITGRKQVEEELQKRDELLEAANKELEAFSYSVSHDLRAPLRSLDGFSQVLLEDCAGKLNDQEKDYLNRIRAASQRMGHLIDALLGLSRATRVELRREPVDLSAVALRSAEEVQKLWPDRQVELVVVPDLRAQGDSQLLRIVFDNLLGNAWKFTSKRAQARIEVGVMAHHGTMAYFVRDNGAGFDMTYAAKLFGVFQRLHAMTEYPGTGIGLATVQRIVARHGGLVWAEGQVDEGATVYFTLAE